MLGSLQHTLKYAPLSYDANVHMEINTIIYKPIGKIAKENLNKFKNSNVKSNLMLHLGEFKASLNDWSKSSVLAGVWHSIEIHFVVKKAWNLFVVGLVVYSFIAIQYR